MSDEPIPVEKILQCDAQVQPCVGEFSLCYEEEDEFAPFIIIKTSIDATKEQHCIEIIPQSAVSVFLSNRIELPQGK